MTATHEARSPEFARPCRNCGADTQQTIGAQAKSNASKAYGWWCFKCHRWQPAKGGRAWISHEELVAAGFDLDMLPVVDVVGAPRCSVGGCFVRGAEVHHWAPRAVFKDAADTWPTDYLCPKHHQEWHSRMKS